MPYVNIRITREGATAEQKARILPKMACGEEVWAQGWSEPNAGSDMAAIQATARRDGDHYVLRGQKTWASRGASRPAAVNASRHASRRSLAPHDASGPAM